MELDLKIQNPQQMLEILFSLSWGIFQEKNDWKNMVYKTDIHRQFGYAFAEIRGAQQMSKIEFSFSRQISAEEPRDKHV